MSRFSTPFRTLLARFHTRILLSPRSLPHTHPSVSPLLSPPPPPPLTPLRQSLGYGILAGSTLVKLPQLLNVIKARSAEGLNPLSFELESVGLSVAATYGLLLGLPLSAYGETVAILIQNNLLLFLIYHFQRRSIRRTLLLVSFLLGWSALVLSGGITPSRIAVLYDANNVLLLAARVPQILQNFGARSTGQLSRVTYGLNTLGSAARIFTSLHEGAGAAMLRGAALSTALNGVLFAQILAYARRHKQE